MLMRCKAMLLFPSPSVVFHIHGSLPVYHAVKSVELCSDANPECIVRFALQQQCSPFSEKGADHFETCTTLFAPRIPLWACRAWGLSLRDFVSTLEQ